MKRLSLMFCVACSGKADPTDTGTPASPQDTVSDSADTAAECQQTTGDLQIVSAWLEGARDLSPLTGARVTISEEGADSFEAILEEDGQLTISLSPGDYAVSSADSSTGRCLEAEAVEATVVTCALATVTLEFMELDGC